MQLDRRGFLLTSVRFGTAAALLPACAPAEEELPEGEGTFGAPLTRNAPGQYQDKIEIHLPRVYGARLDATRVRLWTEVQDTTVDPVKNHEMIAEHYISQIVLQDNFLNPIASRNFAYDAQARLVTTVELDERVTSIEALALCNQHLWWRAVYDTADLAVPPDGAVRRAYTLDQPGDYAAQALTHAPIFGRRPNGSYGVEVGDRNGDTLHPMDEAHYIQTIYIFDEYDQLRAQANLTPQYLEPVADFPANAIAGTARVRVLALCNNYKWWEAEYAL